MGMQEASDTETARQPMEGDSVVVLDELKLREIIANGSLSFEEWTSLVSEIERTCPDDAEIICLVYDCFLSKFPLCYGYWRKYVDHKIRLSTIDKVVEVFERAVTSATYCIEIWVDYCNFGSLNFENPSDVRRLFKRAISFVGKDYLCHTLWDKYIEFEFSQRSWSSLAHIYIQTLRFPTKKLHQYNNSFKMLVGIWKEEMESCGNYTLEVSIEAMLEGEVSTGYKHDDIACIIKELLDPFIGLAVRFKALQKYISIGARFYKESSELNEKINLFENRIRRPYFHVKPLDASQLENWHQYLDFAELHGDFDWAVKLYERCLVPCANYPEFWMRYVDFLESKGGREIANFALERATQTFLKTLSVVHLFNARYKEQTGDVPNACAAFLQCDSESDQYFVEKIIMKANMEKRLGNFTAAFNTYKEALEMAAAKKKRSVLPILYVHFSRLKYLTTDSKDAAIDILLDGIKHVPCCKLLIEELIKFSMTHEGSRNINVVDSVVVNSLSPGPGVSHSLSAEDGEDVSRLYLEFVDLCGSIHDVRKAWNRHIRLFPQSVRTIVCPDMGVKKWKMAKEAQEMHVTLPLQPSGDCEIHVTLPCQPSGDGGSDCQIQSLSQDKKPFLPENHDTQEASPAVEGVSDQNSPLLGNGNSISGRASDDVLQADENDESMQENVENVSSKFAEPSGEESNAPLDTVHQFADEKGVLDSQEFSKEYIVRQECDHKPEHDLKPPSMERLSLDHHDTKTPGSISPTSYDSEAPQKISPSRPTSLKSEMLEESSLSNGRMLKTEAHEENSTSKGAILEIDQQANVDHFVSRAVSTQAAASAQIDIGNYEDVARESISQPHMPSNNDRRWHQKSDRMRRDSKFGFHGHSNKRSHQQRQHSPQRQCTRTEIHSQGYSSQPWSSQSPQVQQASQAQSQYPTSGVNANQTGPQAWSMQNRQQQNLSSAPPSQPSVQSTTYPQSQISHNASQNKEQGGNVQNHQAYNQMSHYYFYQQQQQFLWQQLQQLQQLYPQQQQLLQQQYQQQLMQLQYLQQQQQLPYQQQQMQQQEQQQQLMQQQFVMQQSYHQQHLQHQHLLYPQQPQQHHQQQQNPTRQQQQHEQEQGQPEQQTETSHIQGQVTPPQGSASGAVKLSASPHTQQQSSQSR